MGDWPFGTERLSILASRSVTEDERVLIQRVLECSTGTEIVGLRYANPTYGMLHPGALDEAPVCACFSADNFVLFTT